MLDFIDEISLKKEYLSEKVAFLIPPFLPQKMISIIYADGGAGKSYLSASLAKQLCAKPCVKQVIYIDLDNPISILVERGYDELLLSEPKLKYIHRSTFNLRAFELLLKLEEYALGNNYEGYVFVLDSLRNFCDVDNDRAAMALMDILMNLREAGGSVIGLHHSNKDGKNFKGSSNIRNSADVMYRLERLEGEQGSVNVSLEPQKERAGIRDITFSINTHSLELSELNPKIANMNERQKDFVSKAKAVLTKTPCNKTQLLLACGYEKSDKWARECIEYFEGVFWEAFRDEKNKNQILYTLKNSCEATTLTKLTTLPKIGICEANIVAAYK